MAVDQPIFESTVSEDGPATVVRLRGELDMSTAEDLSGRLDALLADGRHRIVLDLTDLDFVDSTGLSTIVRARTSAVQAGGSLAISSASHRVRRVFDLTGLGGLLASDVEAS